MREPKYWSNDKFTLVRKNMGDTGLWGYYSYELGLPCDFMLEVFNHHIDEIPLLSDDQLQGFMHGLAQGIHSTI